MIILTGTKRSGTSMWMQILDAAGVELIGTAFPKNWDETLRDANPHGFYESPLRRGIFYGTNPHPQTGDYLQPDQTRHLAVKVFIPGLCRTDHAFITQVVGTMRHWREYAASIERMREMENEAARERGREGPPPRRLDPVLEWWLENFALIRNIVTRGYPAHMITYDRVLADPSEALPEILEWVGADDIDAGIDAVSPDTRTQERDRIDRTHPCEDVFDEFYELVHTSDEMTGSFIEKLNQTHEELIPHIEEDRRKVAEDRLRRRRKMREEYEQQAEENDPDEAAEASDESEETPRGPNPLNPDTMESLIHGINRYGPVPADGPVEEE